MSVIRRDNTKVILPRCGPDELWQLLHEHYAGDDACKWKYLAMLALREDAGWPLELIGRVFAHHKGHVQRCVEKIKREIRERFDLSPEWLRAEPAGD